MNLSPDPTLRRNRAVAFAAAIAFFLALAPTLPWQEFSSGPENLVVATAMEMRRGGPWLVPTLQVYYEHNDPPNTPTGMRDRKRWQVHGPSFKRAMKAGVTTVHRSDDRPEARFTSITVK